MPPRKSTEPKVVANGVDEDTPIRGQGKTKDGLGVEDLTLPRTMIQRLAKGVIPANTQIQRDAQLAIVKSATVFVSYLANSANDRAVLANKKTVQPKDVMEALAELEFEAFLPRCEGELALYNTMQCTKRNDYRRRIKEEKEHGGESTLQGSTDGGVSVNGDGNTSQGLSPPGSGIRNGNDIGRGHDLPPAAKKARISLAGASNGTNGTNGTNGLGNEEDAGDDTVDDEETEEGDNEEQSEEDEEGEEDEEEEDDEGDGEVEEAMEDGLERGRRKAYELEDDDEEGGGSGSGSESE